MDLKHNEDYYIKILLEKVKVSEIMTAPALSLNCEAKFSNVADFFKQNKTRHLPITNSKDEVAGLMTERHLYKIASPRKLMDGEWYYDKTELDAINLKHVMIKDPFTIHPEQSIAQALEPMVNQKYGCVPVVDNDNRLCGIITQYDILKIALQIFKS